MKKNMLFALALGVLSGSAFGMELEAPSSPIQLSGIAKLLLTENFDGVSAKLQQGANLTDRDRKIFTNLQAHTNGILQALCAKRKMLPFDKVVKPESTTEHYEQTLCKNISNYEQKQKALTQIAPYFESK